MLGRAFDTLSALINAYFPFLIMSQYGHVTLLIMDDNYLRSLTCSNNSGYFLQKLGLLHNGWAQRLERLQADFVAIVEENEKNQEK